MGMMVTTTYIAIALLLKPQLLPFQETKADFVFHFHLVFLIFIGNVGSQR